VVIESVTRSPRNGVIAAKQWNETPEHEKRNGTTEKRFCRAEKVSQQSDLQPMIQPSRPGFPGGGLGASRARPDFFDHFSNADDRAAGAAAIQCYVL
jgi:hypothetical protein